MSLDLQSIAILNLAIPLVIVLAGGAIWLLLYRGGRWQPGSGRWFDALTCAGSMVCLGLSIVLLIYNQPLDFSFLGMAVYMDALSIYFVFLVNIIAAFAAWNTLAAPTSKRPLLSNVFVNLFHVTMLLVPMVNNLILLWIAVEATTLVSTFLVSLYDEKNSWEAAWKYLIITSTGIIFALLGTMFLANAAKHLLPVVAGNSDQIMNWSFLLAAAKGHNLASEFVILSFLFILVGYGTKAGFAPMHTWLTDGHSEAPAAISALLSGVLLKSALYAILRFTTITNCQLGSSEFTSRLLLATGLISLLLATPFVLNERNRFKRVLAYHSLEHMGIIAFGIGIGGEIALFGALLHTLNHALTKSLMFLAFGNVMRRFTELGVAQLNIANVLRRMPITGGALALGGLALVGTPPFNIFLSELIILWGALSPNATPRPAWLTALVVGLFMVSTTLIFYGLIRHLARVLLPSSNQGTIDLPAVGAVGAVRLKESLTEALPLVLLTGLIVVTGLVVWAPLAAVLNASVAILLQ